MKNYQVKVEGMAPGILQHRMNPLMNGKSPTQFDITEWKKGIYIDPEGQIYQPSVCFEQALIEAAKTEKQPGARGASWMKWFKGNIAISPDDIPYPEISFEDFESCEKGDQQSLGNGVVFRNGSAAAIHVVAATVNKAKISRVRPLIYPWTLEFTLHALSDECPPQTLKTILERSGLYPGVGDWRPGSPMKGGKFGRYSVIEFEEA